MWTAPTASDFKARFVRDFPYAPANDQTNPDFVMDADINAALNSAGLNFNDGIGATGPGLTEMYLLLAAFFLVQSLKTAAKGIASKAEFPISSTGVGSVSVSVSIPEEFTSNPVLAQFTANGYGMAYLTLVYPFTVGNIGVFEGMTTSG